jgi:hypothetical protein
MSIRWALEIEGCAERAAADFDHARALAAVENAKQRAIFAAETKAQRKRLELVTRELDAARAWYRSPVVVATISATVSVAALLTAAYLVQSTVEAAR